MPHKRAKRSIRLSETAKRGTNLPPPASIVNDTPRSASRILNSHSVQSAFRAAGRVTSEDTGERKGKRKAEPPVEPAPTSKRKRKEKVDKGKAERGIVDGIRAGETLGEYNRRVESIFRRGVTRAIQDAKSSSKGKSKPLPARPVVAAEADVTEERTFAPIPQPRRLNDIVLAPPVLPHLRRAGKVKEGAGGVFRATGRTPLNLGQQRLLEEERERVVSLYRRMKEERLVSGPGRGGRKGKVAVEDVKRKGEYDDDDER